MSKLFEELDYRPTEMGALSLRRRRHLQTGRDIFEVKLGDEFLMSTEFTDAEVALGDIGIKAACQSLGMSAAVLDGTQAASGAERRSGGLDVVVGGLGLGYTAASAAKYEAVRSLVVVDAFQDVIDWHQQSLVPLGSALRSDSRCRMVAGDFFEMAAQRQTGFDPSEPGRRFHAILLDIDHSPTKLLHSRHAHFYEPAGLRSLKEHLVPNGIFALWSNDPPDESFMGRLRSVFCAVEAHVVSFENAWLSETVSNTVYVAHSRSSS